MLPAGENQPENRSERRTAAVTAVSAPRNGHAYAIFRSSAYPDGRSSSHYEMAGQGVLAVTEFNDWLTRASVSARHTVDVLAIREQRDLGEVLLACVVERRRGSAEGPLYGDPARVAVTGAAEKVSAQRISDGGQLQEAVPDPAAPLQRLPRDGVFAGEAQAIRDAFGEGVRIVSVREPTVTEDLIGLASIFRVATMDRRELGCGVGWHGTMPFVLQADFPRLDAQPLAAADAWPDLETAGPGAGAADEWRDQANADQAVWLCYAGRHENLAILDVRPDGVMRNILVMTGDEGGRLTWHLIDSDGVELWRKPPEDLVADMRYRERTHGLHPLLEPASRAKG
jgi:hypothetical protein